MLFRLFCAIMCGVGVLVVSPSLASAGEAKSAQEVKGRISHVTLYRGQALVTRTIPLGKEKGELTLVVADLPEQVAPDSLYAEGDEQVQVRAVRFRVRAVGQQPREELRKLETSIEEVQRKLELNSKNQQLLDKRSKYLDSLEGFVAPTAKTELSKGVLDAEALEKITNFSFEQRRQIVTEQVELGKTAKDLGKQLELLQRQMAELTAGAANMLREAVLFLDKRAEGPQQVRLNYLVNQCGWSPSYTIRAGDDPQKVRVEYNGLIQQMSGEDWIDVTFTLSTASPAMSASGPGLAPFPVALTNPAAKGPKKAVDLLSQAQRARAQQQAAIVQNFNSLNLAGNIDASWQANSAANDLQCLEIIGDKRVLNVIRQTAGQNDEGPSLSYQLAGPVNLASRSDQQMVRIMHSELPSRLYYVATPLLTSYVYREAELTNNSEKDLLGGSVTVYLEGRFVGRCEIPMVARGERFLVGLGADPQLRARRDLTNKSEDVQGGNRELQFTYRLAVENYKDRPARVRLLDRLPKSDRDADIRVTLTQGTESLSTNPIYVQRERDKNLLRWDIEVAASATGEKAHTVNYAFKVEYDRQYRISAATATPQAQQEFEEQQRIRVKY